MYTFHMLSIECAHSTAETCEMYTFNGEYDLGVQVNRSGVSPIHLKLSIFSHIFSVFLSVFPLLSMIRCFSLLIGDNDDDDDDNGNGDDDDDDDNDDDDDDDDSNDDDNGGDEDEEDDLSMYFYNE